MSGMGTAMMGTGESTGDQRAIAAAEEAIANPLLDDISLRGAKGLLVSIIGGRDLTLYEVDEAASRVRQEVDPDANIIVGATFDESLGDRVRVSIVASGMSPDQPRSGASLPNTHLPVNHHQPGPPPPPQTPYPPPYPQTYRQPAAPSTQEAAGHNDDVTDALRKAIEEQQPAAAGEPRSQQVWRGPGDVLIEEGLPQLGPGPSAPPPQKSGPAGARPAEPFMPAPPIETRRAQRRMPTVEDFPVVGQREYRAKTAWHETGHQAQSAPRPYAPDSNPPAKKPGLFSRITGFSWRTEHQPPQQEQSFTRGARTAGDRIPSGRSASPRPARLDQPSRNESESSEDVELPVFFHTERKRP